MSTEFPGPVPHTLVDIAGQADGVRCDMAMLLRNEIFARTWGDRCGPVPAQEYWTEVIGTVRAAYPDFGRVGRAEAGPPAVAPADAPDRAVTRRMAGVAGFIRKEEGDG